MYRVVCKNYLGECSDVSTLEITQSEFRARGATLPYYERFKQILNQLKSLKEILIDQLKHLIQKTQNHVKC